MTIQPLAAATTWRTVADRLIGRAVDAVLPPRCLECGGQVDAAGALCPACWQRMEFLGPPCCACCGLPFEVEMGANALCGACIAEPPGFARARAVFRYDEASRGLVLRFKHADRTDAAPAFGRWLARAGTDMLAEIDLIAPVPMHWFRLFLRRYNQAALLANELAGTLAQTGFRAAVVPDLLVRRRWTPSQGNLGRQARHDNVRGAIAVRSGCRPRLQGKRVLVVDDVMTTGATASVCARALLRAGASGVDVLTLARVVRE